MRSTDERVNEVLGRARAREATSRRRRQRVAALGGGVLAVVIVATVGVGMSSLPGAVAASAGATLGLMGSVFAGGSALGYVVVGLLGLALGAAVTVLAYRLGHARAMLAPRDEDEISAHTLPGHTKQFSKGQAAKNPSESVCTNPPDRTDSGRTVEAEAAFDAEGREP